LKPFDGIGSGLKWEFKKHMVWQQDKNEAACCGELHESAVLVRTVYREKPPSKEVSVRTRQSTSQTV